MKNEELDVRARREQLEADKMTRRAALKKMGLTTGFALFGMFAVDDLARMTMTRLQQMHLHNEAVNTVAQEFKNVGVAFAGSKGTQASSTCFSPDCHESCAEDDSYKCVPCQPCFWLYSRQCRKPCTPSCGNSGCSGCSTATEAGTCCGQIRGILTNADECQQCCDALYPASHGINSPEHDTCWGGCNG